MTAAQDRDAERDAWLREALRHAPDAGVTPPSALSDAILREARGAAPQRTRPPIAVRAAAPSLLRAFWDWLGRPPVAAGFASVLAATLVGMLWWGRPLDEALPQAPPPARDVGRSESPVVKPPSATAPAAGSDGSGVAAVPAQRPSVPVAPPAPTARPQESNTRAIDSTTGSARSDSGSKESKATAAKPAPPVQSEASRTRSEDAAPPKLPPPALPGTTPAQTARDATVAHERVNADAEVRQDRAATPASVEPAPPESRAVRPPDERSQTLRKAQAPSTGPGAERPATAAPAREVGRGGATQAPTAPALAAPQAFPAPVPTPSPPTTAALQRRERPAAQGGAGAARETPPPASTTVEPMQDAARTTPKAEARGPDAAKAEPRTSAAAKDRFSAAPADAGANRLAGRVGAPIAGAAAGSPLAALRSAIDAEPGRWSWQRDGGMPVPMNELLRRWLAELDAEAATATAPGPAPAPMNATPPSAAPGTLRLLRDGRLHTTLLIVADRLRADSVDDAASARPLPLRSGAGVRLLRALPAAP
jgi:hypothetical protein